MVKDPNNLPNEEAPGHPESSANKHQASHPSGQERQEQYQRTREHAAVSQGDQDRDARIRRRAHEIWEQEGQPEGLAEEHWNRAARGLDQENVALRREGVAG